MNTKEKGDVAVGLAIAHFVSEGKEVLLPIGDKQKYDLVIEDNGKFFKIQCKYTSYNAKGKRSYVAPLYVGGGNKSSNRHLHYKTGDFDLFFVATPDGSYLIPWDVLKRLKKEVALSHKYSEYKLRTAT